MANEKQYKLRTLFVGTRGVEEYRESISTYVSEKDKVLEIGCEWGTTSKLIYPKCSQLIATDISPKCIERARKMYPEIHFETLDVYDIKRAQSFDINFNKMYIDVSGLSGYRSVLDVLALLNMYASVFEMEAIVIKSGALKELGKRLISWEKSSIS
ncbi:class I SAM-dependent methyltransferase [Candidatus Dojkabacteria bacterium]|nr:class I SAM-dependent methyltransferase [Candidatus Dojkabacteria bacterium]